MAEPRGRGGPPPPGRGGAAGARGRPLPQPLGSPTPPRAATATPAPTPTPTPPGAGGAPPGAPVPSPTPGRGAGGRGGAAARPMPPIPINGASSASTTLLQPPAPSMRGGGGGGGGSGPLPRRLNARAGAVKIPNPNAPPALPQRPNSSASFDSSSLDCGGGSMGDIGANDAVAPGAGSSSDIEVSSITTTTMMPTTIPRQSAAAAGHQLLAHSQQQQHQGAGGAARRAASPSPSTSPVTSPTSSPVGSPRKRTHRRQASASSLTTHQPLSSSSSSTSSTSPTGPAQPATLALQLQQQQLLQQRAARSKSPSGSPSSSPSTSPRLQRDRAMLVVGSDPPHSTGNNSNTNNTNNNNNNNNVLQRPLPSTVGGTSTTGMPPRSVSPIKSRGPSPPLITTTPTPSTTAAATTATSSSTSFRHPSSGRPHASSGSNLAPPPISSAASPSTTQLQPSPTPVRPLPTPIPTPQTDSSPTEQQPSNEPLSPPTNDSLDFETRLRRSLVLRGVPLSDPQPPARSPKSAAVGEHPKRRQRISPLKQKQPLPPVLQSTTAAATSKSPPPEIDATQSMLHARRIFPPVYPLVLSNQYPAIALPRDNSSLLPEMRQTIARLHAQYLEAQQENIELRRQLNKRRAKALSQGRLEIEIDEDDANSSWLMIQEQLARIGGSMAGVFSVAVDGWGCAMKCIHVRDPDELIAIETEIHTLESLPPHPNVVRYLYHCRHQGYLRLFMTKYAGTLSRVITRRAGLKDLSLVESGKPVYLDHPVEPEVPQTSNNFFSVVDIQRFMLDIARGLAFLHKRRIIHRDLKSENVFITAEPRAEGDSVGRCVIGDFDTAKKLSRGVVAMTVIGTTAYMPPEVLMAKEQHSSYDYKCDIYSFGMILYEVLALQPPYFGMPPFEISTCIVSGERPVFPMSLFQLDQYHPLICLFQECTHSDPSLRPTAQQIVSVLEIMNGCKHLSGDVPTHLLSNIFGASMI